jgi:hypothetical protein
MTDSEPQQPPTEPEPQPDQSPFPDPPMEEVERGLNPFERETRSNE